MKTKMINPLSLKKDHFNFHMFLTLTEESKSKVTIVINICSCLIYGK